jgi:hypothetical protein
MRGEYLAGRCFPIAKREWKAMVTVPQERLEKGRFGSTIEEDALDMAVSQPGRGKIPIVAVDDGVVFAADHYRRPVTIR